MNPELEPNDTNCRGNVLLGWRPNALHPIAERHSGAELVEGAIASVIASSPTARDGRGQQCALQRGATTTSKISEDMLFYCIAARALGRRGDRARGQRFRVTDVLQQLPIEFAVEAQKLISVSSEGSVG
jgi:hypothetical protein